MRDRYKKPPSLDEPPDLYQLPDILHDAMRTDDEEAENNEREDRRRRAVDALLKFARAEVAEARAEAARACAQLTEAIMAHVDLEKDVAQGLAKAITRHGAERANAQRFAETIARFGFEKSDAHGIAEAMAGGVATAGAQGIAKAMLTLAVRPLTGFEDFKENPRHYAWTFLAEAWLRILTAEDPVAELTRFLGTGRKRGRPADPDSWWRDTIIAGSVQEQVDSGLRIQDAFAVISADIHLTPDAVEKIYYAHRGKPGHKGYRKILEFADRAHQK
jgi:hypothetical protein